VCRDSEKPRDYFKATKELGWRPWIEFEDGMKKTVALCRSLLDSRNPEIIDVPNA
jgi:nucleoside-diphosphate-sugar epimerase